MVRNDIVNAIALPGSGFSPRVRTDVRNREHRANIADAVEADCHIRDPAERALV